MHPGPVNCIELPSSIIDSHFSTREEQVTNGCGQDGSFIPVDKGGGYINERIS